MDSFDQAVEQYHAGLLEFVKGDSGPVLQLFSQRDDAVLSNPMRPFALGPREIAETTQQAASHFADGTLEFEPVTGFSTADLGYTVHIERFRAIIDGAEGTGASGLRRSSASKRTVGGSHTDTRTQSRRLGR